MTTSFGSNPAANLAEEHQAIRELTALLQQEQEQLIAANTESLAALTEPKAKATARLAELAARRHAALGAAGFEPREAGMKAWIGSPAAPTTAGQSWQELMKLVEAAKEINRVNGTLIHRQMARNQDTLNVLRYGTPQGNGVYGPSGHTEHSPFARHIVAG